MNDANIPATPPPDPLPIRALSWQDRCEIAEAKRDALAFALQSLVTSIEASVHEEWLAQPIDLAKAALKENQ